MSRRLSTSLLPYTKLADLPGDQEQLQPYYDQIDALPEVLAGQHAIRRWEYGMALRTIGSWRIQDTCSRRPWVLGSPLDPIQICDIGGAGSNFWQVLRTLTPEDILLIDPAVQVSIDPPAGRRIHQGTVEDFAATAPHDSFDVITCISVIEHLPDKQLRTFFRAVRMLLKPGGLLFLTTDCWDKDGPDVAHYHWMRARIWNPEELQEKLMDKLRELGYKSFGQADWAYHGHQLYDYSVASIAVTRKEI